MCFHFKLFNQHSYFFRAIKTTPFIQNPPIALERARSLSLSLAERKRGQMCAVVWLYVQSCCNLVWVASSCTHADTHTHMNTHRGLNKSGLMICCLLAWLVKGCEWGVSVSCCRGGSHTEKGGSLCAEKSEAPFALRLIHRSAYTRTHMWGMCEFVNR